MDINDCLSRFFLNQTWGDASDDSSMFTKRLFPHGWRTVCALIGNTALEPSKLYLVHRYDMIDKSSQYT